MAGTMFILFFLMNVPAIVTTEKLNFLLIIVDDLRTTLGCYGDEKAYTPRIDRLAERSIVFSQAFAQQALCAPSRNSFLTGRRPDTLQLYDFYSYWRDAVGNFTTLPEHLKNNGYTTMSIGKVFHPGISSNGSDDSPYSWTETPFHPYTDRFKNSPVCQSDSSSSRAQNIVCPVTVSSMPNKTLPDIETFEEAISFLRKRRRDKPFFLAVGFQKPHIPLKYPERYLKYHPLEKFQIPQPYEWPDINSVAYNPWTDLRKRDDVKELNLKFPWQKIPPLFGSRIIQSYYAAVSYVDDMIGMLIDELDTSNVRDNTAIILISDHGWSLGEHAEWSKYSNFDVSTHVPFLISVPGLTFETNKYTNIQTACPFTNRTNKIKIYQRTNALAELVDLFPTIADIAGVQIPLCPRKNRRIHNARVIDELPNPCSEGISLLPLIKAVKSNKAIPWKKAAFSQYPRPGVRPTLIPNSDKPRLKEIRIMGYTLKTRRYRYTAWLPFAWKSKRPNWRNIIAEELYDHASDTAENINIANSPKQQQIKKKLKRLLRCGWTCTLPFKLKRRIL